jgi:hypothetical protein
MPKPFHLQNTDQLELHSDAAGVVQYVYTGRWRLEFWGAKGISQTPLWQYSTWGACTTAAGLKLTNDSIKLDRSKSLTTTQKCLEDVPQL